MKLVKHQTALAALAVSSLGVVSSLPQAHPSGGYENSSVIRPDDFVYVDGHYLKTSNGSHHYLTGINYWACMNIAADDEVGGNFTRLTTELDQMAEHGINHLRIMAGSEGNPEPQPFRMRPALQEAPGVYNDHIWVGLDRCLAEMEKRGMRATMTLNNQWQWSGGFNQYVSWANDNETVTYPSSWNLTKEPQRDEPRTGWGNYTEEGDALYTDFNNYTAYGNLIYNNTRAEEIYKNHIYEVMHRRNTVNGRTYIEDATIMSWQLANEPQVVNPQNYSGPYDLVVSLDNDDPLLAWIDRISTYIKSLAPRQLCSLGFESKQGEDYFKAVHGFDTIDYTTAHCWIQNWGVYDMLNSSLANLATAQTFAQDFVANTSRWAAEIGKPIFLEEFGAPRNNWELVEAGEEYEYLSSARTTNKDAYFATIIETALSLFKHPDGAYIGTCPWAYGGVFRPETQVINDFGMVWAGDPPHEAPGWYDLYDDDYAMVIVRRQMEEAEAWIEEVLDAGRGNRTVGR